MNSRLFIITGVIQLASATTILVPPNETVCPGDTVTFNCSVTRSTCGVLSWSVNNIAVGSFLDVTGRIGTKASNPDFPEVVSTITDIDVDANNISSSLIIPLKVSGFNKLNVVRGSQILCTDHNEQDQTELMLAMIDLNTTVCPSLVSASVIVQFRDPSALECIVTYHIEVQPTIASQSPPIPMNSRTNNITFHELNFCESNYTFNITVFDRNNNTYNEIVPNVVGNLDALKIDIVEFQNGSVLQWNLMRSDHPENCDVMYEISFIDNGGILCACLLVPETQVSKEKLIQLGFPYCRSTVVSVVPHVSAHDVIRNFTRNTTYLTIPDYSGPTIVKSIPKFIYKNAESTELQVVYNWDPVPPGTFGRGVDITIAVNFTCDLMDTASQLMLHSKCNSIVDHSFPIFADKKPFGKKYLVTVQVDYFECRYLSSASHASVTAVINSFPKLTVMATSVSIELDINSTLVPDGSNVILFISSIQMEPQNPVSNGNFSTIVYGLQPDYPYDYNITFSRNDSGVIIDRPIYGHFMTSEKGVNLALILGCACAVGSLILILIIMGCCCYRYYKGKRKQDDEGKRKQDSFTLSPTVTKKQDDNEEIIDSKMYNPETGTTANGPGPIISSNWTPQNNFPRLKSVDQSSNEWIQVKDKVHFTLEEANIIDIQLIHNKWLWDVYVQSRLRLKEKNRGNSNEKLLFHGSSETPPEQIYNSENGFDFRFANKGLWGEGAYFAVNARYSNAYAYESSGRRQFFLSWVLTGESKSYNHEDKSLKMPPLKEGNTDTEFAGERYDSVHGKTGGSDVYVVYEHSKAYPAYLITYSLC